MRSATRAVLSVILALPTARAAECQQNVAAGVSRDTFGQWMTKLSNANRWGPGDELGTLNFITPALRRAAAQGVRDGVTVSLARDVIAGPDSNAIAPARVGLAFAPNGHPDSLVFGAIDTLWIIAHGWAYTHIDALAHFAYRGSMYNGVPARELRVEGARKLGIERMRAGVVGRGVLVDLPRLRNVPYLSTTTAITSSDLDAWERKTGVRITAGDIVLIRTGRDERTRLRGPWLVPGGAAGPHPSLVEWLGARHVAALGSDVGNELAPSVVEAVSDPVHLLAIVALGMPLLDNLDLERLARESVARSRQTFLFVAAPMPIRGATGSLVNPLAIF